MSYQDTAIYKWVERPVMFVTFKEGRPPRTTLRASFRDRETMRLVTFEQSEERIGLEAKEALRDAASRWVMEHGGPDNIVGASA